MGERPNGAIWAPFPRQRRGKDNKNLRVLGTPATGLLEI